MLEHLDDLNYRPHSDSWTWLESLDPETALVIGTVTDEQATNIDGLSVDEARAAQSRIATRQLSSGAYAFKVEARWHAILVFGARSPGPAASARYRTDDTHLGAARDIYKDHWDGAESFLGGSPFAPGDFVRPRSERVVGQVSSIRRSGGRHQVAVEIKHSLQSFDAEDLELMDGDPRSPEFWLRQDPASADDIGLTLSWLKLKYPLTDVLYSYAATKTTFKPYQFIPALKILNSATSRLLIADEVGLGKTIEAGLIWTELEQRAPIRRALVVVPAALRIKWQQEMDRRFMRTLPLLEKSDLREFAEKLRQDQDPEFVGIVSIESLRGAGDLLADLADLNPHFDLAIVDEAHVLRNRTSKSHHVGELLSDWADYLVFLSATPLNLGSEDLYNLVHLLDEGGFPDRAVFNGQLEPNKALNAVARIVSAHGTRSRASARQQLSLIHVMEHGGAMSRRPDFSRLRALLSGDAPLEHFEIAAIKRNVAELNTLGGVLSRTRKVDVPDKKAKRVAEQIAVVWTDQERNFYEAVVDHYRRKAQASGLPVGFAMQMPLRQASSSIPVMRALMREREGWAYEANDEDSGFEDWDSISGTEGPTEWDAGLARLADLSIERDSKLEALKSRLRAVRDSGSRQILIFSFFRGTVEYLARSLSPEFSTGILHGGIPMANRQDVITGFRNQEFEILIANQVGSEGLDFEFCNVLVNYDLPWNPMQVEQRIGRLDRFGQQHDKILIFNMHVPGTIESEIIGRLYMRIGVFENSIGDLEPIMRSTMQDVERLLDPTLSPTEREADMDRIAVALEKKRSDVRQLEESSGVLTTVSQLDIDGLTEDGPSSGRYIGHHELFRLLSTLLETFKGTIDAGPRADLFIVRGSLDLARALRDVRQTDGGTMIGVGRLVGLLRDGHPVTISFKPEAIGNEAIELITARHPLIRLAVATLGEKAVRLQRFGTLCIDGLASQSRILARVDLVRSVGVRPLCELWVTTMDLETGASVEGLEEQFMVAVADGTLRNSNAPLPSNLHSAAKQLAGILDDRHQNIRSERRQDNSALVDARIESLLHSNQIKIDRTREQLSHQRMTSNSPNIIRMQEGRLRNLTRDRDEIRQKYEEKRHLTMSVEQMAIIYITGCPTAS